MNENFEIVLEYIKDLSAETPDAETLVFVRNNISKYQMNININSKAVKNKMIEITTQLTFDDKEKSKKKSFFEISYATIIRIKKDIKEKKLMEKIIICDVQKEVYPRLEKIFLNIIKDSGFPDIRFDKKIDFEKLYTEKFN
tara:strand:- start:347 stop:769 length:423 start_codon:yes stop_codon:yes gene_type:complete